MIDPHSTSLGHVRAWVFDMDDTLYPREQGLMQLVQARINAYVVEAVGPRKARQLFAMLDGAVCRAQAVRRYFGEHDAQPCGVCDICGDPPQLYDATVPAHALIKTPLEQIASWL